MVALRTQMATGPPVLRRHVPGNDTRSGVSDAPPGRQMAMALFAWSDDFSVGEPEIDRQHQTLFSLINNLHSAMLAGGGAEKANEVLASLVQYTNEHFSAEEELMRRVRYPELTLHKAVHDAFSRKVEGLLQRQRQGGKSLVTIEVMNMLKDWLTAHIKGIDHLYAPYIART
jgi:hemerythrin